MALFNCSETACPSIDWRSFALNQRVGRINPPVCGLIAAIAMLSGCDTYRNINLAVEQDALRQECFGNFTNACMARNIDFDVAVLQANDVEQWIPFNDVKTKQQMIDAFGPDGWGLFQESVDAVRSEVIAHLQSRRPGWFVRTFMADEQPLNGGVRAFLGPEDLVPIKAEMRTEFIRRLKEAGWTPSPDVAARYGLTPPPMPNIPNISNTTPTSPPAAAPTDGNSAGASAPRSSIAVAPTELAAEAHQEWQNIRKQITEDPQAFVHDCIKHRVDAAERAGKQNRWEAHEDAETPCSNQLGQLRSCMAMDSDSAERCYAQISQNSE